MSVRLIIDSSTNLPEDLRRRMHVVPLTILFGDEEYIDGMTIDHHQFYEKLVSGGELPTTSQATPEAFLHEYQKAKDAGDEVVVLTISSKLSGTCQSAVIAAQDFDNVYVVDSLSVTIGAGILAEYALRLIDEGLCAREVARRLTAAREEVRLVAVLDTLEYLKRGGRISRTVAFAGGLLSIKPTVAVVDGEVALTGKARGTRQAGIQLIRDIEATGVDLSRPVLIGYTGTDDGPMKHFVEESAHLWGDMGASVPTTIVGSVVGTHAGPGAIAVAFFKK